jgi:DNA-binding NarL/FixJ family response regulator
VVLLDVKRGDGGGIEICRKIVRERPSTRVLVLTSYPDEREQGETQAMGAVGYLLKDLDLQELLQQIKVPQGSGMHGNLRGAE